MKYLLYAAKNLQARRARTILTALSIAVAVAVLFTLLSFNKGYAGALQGQLQKIGVHIMVVPSGCPYEAASLLIKGGQIPNYLDESVTPRVASVEGVQIAAPAFMQAVVRPDEGRTDIYFGIDERTYDLKNWWRIRSKRGAPMSREQFASAMKKDDAIILGADAALIEQRDVGDLLYVPEIDKEFTVAGILEPTGTQDDGFFFIPLAAAQQMFGKTGKLTAVQVRVKDPAEAGRIAKKLDRMFPRAEIITMSELNGAMMNLMGSARTLIMSIIVVAIAISAIGVMNTILMSVFERTREIGIMRATGAGRGHVFSLIWIETFLLCLGGGAAGLGLAVVAARGIESVVRRVMPIPVSGSVVSLDAGTFAACLLFVLAIGAVAGLYPGWRASRTRPIEALRAG